MNKLPDLIVLDFCEWLAHKTELKYETTDFYDLLLDQEYRYRLEKYAEEYLCIRPYIKAVKKILQRFIDSDLFDVSLINESHWMEYRFIDKKDICRLLRYMISEEVLNDFLEKEHGQWTSVEDIVNYEISRQRRIRPYELAHSASHIINSATQDSRIRSGNKRILNLMNRVDMDVGIEVDFLEWLIEKNGEPIDFRKMPRQTFELLATEFQTECGKTEREKRKLIRSFKQKNSYVLSEKLSAVLPTNIEKRAKDLGYIFSRYQNKTVPYKCVIIPLQSDANEYIELIEKRWYDLHYLSGDYLDIYYSEADYGKSGYEITHQLSKIPKELTTKIPLIMLWEHDMTKAQGIDITRLDNVAVFEVIRCIVNAIREQKNLDEIAREANQMSQDLRDAQRPVNYNTLNIGGNAFVSGPVAVVNDHGEMSMNVEQGSRDADVLQELESAKRIIRNFSEINDRQKELLTEIIDEAKEAIKENSEEKKAASKKHFKNAIDLVGIGGKLISALSALVNVLKYFGINPV